MSAPKDTFIAGLEHAEKLAKDEGEKAKIELGFAAKPSSRFKTVNKDQTQKRMETAKKIIAAIRRAIRQGYPPQSN